MTVSHLYRAISAEGGRVTLARFMEMALTAPDAGYYSSSHRFLGEGGDFTTIPRAAPAFNWALARFLAQMIDLMAEDSPLTLVEIGPGEGDMARGILDCWQEERPELKDAIRYRMVELGEGLIRAQRKQLEPLMKRGWDAGWWGSLPDGEGQMSAAERGRAIVVSNEFLDALPVHLLRVGGGRVEERWVESDEDAETGLRLRENWAEPSVPALRELEMLFGTTDASDLAALSADGFMEVRPGLGSFFRQISGAFAESCVISFDYGEWMAGSPEELEEGGKLAAHQRSLRTYSHHQSAGDLLSYAGRRDITADVDFRAVHIHGESAGFEQVLYAPLAAFLRGTGVEAATEGEQAGLPESLEEDRETSVVRALLDSADVGGLFKVIVQAG